MNTYSKHQPTQFDTHLGREGREHWIVLPCGRNRDSRYHYESNCACALARLGGESDTVEVHRFGHWACGWYEIILVDPASPAAEEARKIEGDLDGYPILDEEDWSEREMTEANEVWKECYSPKERIAYLRTHTGAEFRSFADLLGCIRGKWAPYTSDGYHPLTSG